MAITAVGSYATAEGTALKTLSVSPTTIGDLMVLAVYATATSPISAVSGGGVTTWHALAQATNTGASGQDAELWYGVVTATGAATITITFTATTGIELGCQQFTAGAGFTWSQDGSGGTGGSSTVATTGNYPSLTPAGANELYVGALGAAGGTASGSTVGFSYHTGTFGILGFVYNLTASNPTAQSPNWTQASGKWGAASALLIATATSTPISDSETGAGADAGESVATALSDSDTSSGADAGESIVSSDTDSETSAGADAGESLLVALTNTETSSGLDAGESVVVSITDSETASGLDTGLVTASLADSETSTGADTASTLAAALTDTELGALVDGAESYLAALVDAEVAGGTDGGEFIPGQQTKGQFVRGGSARLSWSSVDPRLSWDSGNSRTPWNED